MTELVSFCNIGYTADTDITRRSSPDRIVDHTGAYPTALPAGGHLGGEHRLDDQGRGRVQGPSGENELGICAGWQDACGRYTNMRQ
jgi:hypothetical protein